MLEWSLCNICIFLLRHTIAFLNLKNHRQHFNTTFGDLGCLQLRAICVFQSRQSDLSRKRKAKISREGMATACAQIPPLLEGVLGLCLGTPPPPGPLRWMKYLPLLSLSLTQGPLPATHCSDDLILEEHLPPPPPPRISKGLTPSRAVAPLPPSFWGDLWG